MEPTALSADRIKHLEFVQGAINRMATNSFLLKGWTVTISAAIFAVAVKGANHHFVLIGLFPALAFWSLDAYYLRRERMFRCLYDEVAGGGTPPSPFSMSTARFEAAVQSWFRTLWCPATGLVHGTAVVLVLVLWRILTIDP
jgi:hypothetical protein